MTIDAARQPPNRGKLIKMYKIMCEFCDKEFKTYNKKRKYCSRECAVNSQKIRIEKVCPVCGTHYETRPSNLSRGGGVCCSRKCAHIYTSKGDKNKKKICKRCGSEKIFQCRISKKNRMYLCKQCRITNNIKRCYVCGKTYLYNHKNSQRCCCKRCSIILRETGLFSKNAHCSLCGGILNSKTKTHKQTWSVCDYCFYLRKKAYKIRPKIQCDDIESTSYKLALLDAIAYQKTGGKKTWEKRARSLMRAAETLQLTT